MSPLRLLVEDTVGGDEIDRNGHLNVRFYTARAMRATWALAESLGLDDATCRRAGVLLVVADAFTRYHREQLVGAPLAVRGGVIDVAADRLRIYHELSNRGTGELAASFVHETRLLDRQSGAFTGLPESLGGGLADSRSARTARSRPTSAMPTASCFPSARPNSSGAVEPPAGNRRLPPAAGGPASAG